MLKENNPIFRISAAVVRQLGEELVSDELTAIMELVKNSYDADADWVKVTINTFESLQEDDITYKNTKGYIIIEDNGEGMDYNDIISKWLFISMSHKRDMKAKGEVTVKKRTPLGDKGLGRLSTQRLGSIFEIFTGKKDQNLIHHVAFDWRDFTEKSSLEKVNTNYNSKSKTLSKTGSRLIISDLKDPSVWIAEAGNRFRAELSKLIFPFKENRPFNIFLNINGQNIDLDEISEKLRKLAISRYKFHFDGNQLIIEGLLKLSKLQGNTKEKRELYNKLVGFDNGANFFEFLINKTGNKKYFLPDIKYSGNGGVFISFKRKFLFSDITTSNVLDKKSLKLIPANPGNFIGEVDEFNLSGTDEIESAYDEVSEYKQLVKSQTGVRIFRDGFGIKPYGMENNDWLKLSKSQTSGGSFYLLRPENVIGFVSITAKNNNNLTEKTDREGFVENAYSKNFFTIVELSVSNINDILEKTRRSYDELKRIDAETNGGIKSFKDTKARLISTAKQSLEIESDAKKVYEDIKNLSIKVSTSVNKIKNEPLFVSNDENKSLGILEEVEVILKNAEKIFVQISSILDNAKQLENDANYLEPKINELERQLIEFSELAGLGITAEAFTHEMYNVIDRIGVQTDQVIKQIKNEGTANTTFFVYSQLIKNFIISIRRQLNHLAPSLKFNKEIKENILLSTFVHEIKEYYTIRNESKIKFELILTKDFAINLNKGKLTQIVDNLILNSEYWLKEEIQISDSFIPLVIIEIKSPFILISDNGYGIVPAFEDNLFQPFVTSKPKGKGRGLGLFIVQQILDSVDSNIILLNQRNQHNRRFIFQINLESALIDENDRS